MGWCVFILCDAVLMTRTEQKSEFSFAKAFDDADVAKASVAALQKTCLCAQFRIIDSGCGAHLKPQQQGAFVDQPVGCVNMHNLSSMLEMHTDNKGVLESAPRVHLLPAMGAQRVGIQAYLVNNNLVSRPDAADEAAF